MQKTSAIKRVSRLAFAAMLAVAMCAPVCAYAAEPRAAEPEAASTPAAAFAVTMQQGNGEAKGYDSISAALADVADYNYKTNKEAYVITLNSEIAENVTIPANKKVTIDLNGNRLSGVDYSNPVLTVQSKYATLQDSNGYGSIDVIDAAVKIDAGAKLTVSGGLLSSEMGYAIVNDGTLMMTGGVVAGRGMSPVINNGTATISGGLVKSLFTAIENQGKLTVKGGRVETIEGGPAILTQGTGSLTVSGGEISAEGDVVAARDTSSVTVTGGTMDGHNCGIRAYSDAKINISGGIVGSFFGCALFVENEVAATISGGEFKCAAGSKAIERTDNATVTLSGGAFNVAAAADLCDSPVFVDRYGAVERDGKVFVDMVRPAAVVIAEDGTRTAYDTFTKACSNAPAYSTVMLMEDAVLTKYAAEVKQFGVTVDLNGHNIDATGYTGKKAALIFMPKYGAKPVEGKDSTLRLINSNPATGGTVTAKLPVSAGCGDSRYEAPVAIADDVALVSTAGGAQVELDSSAYLMYSNMSADYVSNGGFKVQATDGSQRIYGSYAHAASVAAPGSTVLMLHDCTSNDPIYTGNTSGMLDLGGHVYTYTGTRKVVDINYDGVSFTLKNGIVKAEKPLTDSGVSMLYSDCSFTMEGVTMEIPGDSWGIGSNGTEANNTVVLKDSTLNVPEGLGIYFPCTGSVTVDNSVINAKHFGVQVCAGNLTVTGEKTSITATGAPQPKAEGDGPIIDGAAVSVVKREGYQALGSVRIEGGSFKSAASSKAVKTYAFNNADKAEGEWPEAGTVVAVSGGTFSSPVAEGICAEGFAPQANADGTFGVHQHSFGGAWASDADGHWQTCGICGAVSEKAPHAFEWVIDKPATATEAGSKHEQCTECGFAKAAVEIPADPSLGEQGGDQGGQSGNQGGDQQSGSQSSQSNQGQTLPQAGDASAALTVSMVLFALTSAALLFLARRRIA